MQLNVQYTNVQSIACNGHIDAHAEQ